MLYIGVLMNQPEKTDTELITSSKSGDREAFRILVDRYRKMLFTTAFLMTGDRLSAEDSVQEALIKIWIHLPSLNKEASIKAWMLRIVANEVKQLTRRKKVGTVPIDTITETVDPELSEVILSSEERQGLRLALRTLPQQDHELIVLRYYSDLTVPEIAVITGLRQGTVKSRLSRALQKLHRILQVPQPTISRGSL